MKTVTIIGYGRFGKTLAELLCSDFKVTIYTRKDKKINRSINIHFTQSLEDAYRNDTVFFAVPISAFESVVKNHKKYFRENQTLMDNLSVKLHAENVFKKFLKNTKTKAILTHPMFGPDSAKNSFEGLPLVMSNFSASGEIFKFWKSFFESKKIKVIEISAEDHDRLAANSQGLTHFVGRLLEKMKFENTDIDSLGSKKLLEIMDQTCNDTWELFRDLQTFNPYTKRMRVKLGAAYEKIYNQLLPKRVSRKYTVFGIQGGLGSFNEEALFDYLKRTNIKKYKIKYLYTTKRVLSALHEADIDYGLFAITNSTGGLVEESMQALPLYRFRIVEDFQIMIRHMLMIRQDTEKSRITAIMAHPQGLKQCETTLEKKYARLSKISGSQDLVDTAKAAESVATGKLPKTTAILGPENLASRYNFEIIDRDLQDNKNNLTRFLLIKR